MTEINISDLINLCKLKYTPPTRTYVRTTRCMYMNLDENNGYDCENKNCTLYDSYADKAMINYPFNCWTFCNDHSSLSIEQEVKYAITNLYGPISPYYDKFINVVYEGQNLEVMIRFFRVSKNLYPGEPVALLCNDKKMIYMKIKDIVEEIKKIEPKELNEYEKSINDLYFKIVPNELIEKFPKFLFY